MHDITARLPIDAPDWADDDIIPPLPDRTVYYAELRRGIAGAIALEERAAGRARWRRRIGLAVLAIVAAAIVGASLVGFW